MEVRTLPLDVIEPNPEQPRDYFAGIEGLAESVGTDGLLEPVMVRRLTGGERYQLVHGERRFRACQVAGLKEIPAIVREDLDEKKAFRLSLVENVQRSNLTPMEEARSYRRLVDDGHTQAQIGKMIGRGQSYVAHKLRLLRTPPPMTRFLETAALTENHLRQALRLKKIDGGELEDGVFEWDAADPTKELDDEGAFVLSARMRPYGATMIPMRRGGELTAAMQSWWDYVSKHTQAPPLWERLAFWHLCYMADHELTVPQAVKTIDTFEDSLYSNIAASSLDLRDEFGGSERWPWSRYQWAIYHDLKHAGVWNEVRGDTTAGLELELRALNRTINGASMMHPSEVWTGGLKVPPQHARVELLDE